MAYLDEMVAIRDALVSELKTETAYRAAHGPKPSYSVGGRSVSWSEWLTTMMDQIKAANILINAEDSYEFHVRGYPGG